MRVCFGVLCTYRKAIAHDTTELGERTTFQMVWWTERSYSMCVCVCTVFDKLRWNESSVLI
jgi:hypothetical protein